jgi:hypothetical protein
MLDFTLDMAEVFTYANNVVSKMLPVVYVTAGLSLGFVVVSKILSAFRS